MKPSFHFRSHLTLDREILAQSATFLPGTPAWDTAETDVFTPESQQMAAFLPVLNFNFKKTTLAHPLLEGGLR
jgi:hypothetical protein